MTFFAELIPLSGVVFSRLFPGGGSSEYLTAGGIFLVSVAAVWLIRPLLGRLAGLRGDRDRRGPVDRVVDAIVPPLRVLPVIVGGYIALHVLALGGRTQGVADQLLKSLIVATAFWAIARVSSNVDLLWDRLNLSLEHSARRWLGYAVQIFMLIFGAVIILEIWNIPVAPLIGSLGVFGIAVGLAARDLFSNLISGILIMTEKRFGPGEWIRVDGVVEGTVEEINFRSTRIRRFDLSPVYVPNALLADNATTNFSRMTYRRIYWMIGLEYSTPPDKLEEIRNRTEAWLGNDERICQPPAAPLFVRIDSFGESSINLMIYSFTRTTAWGEWLRIKEDFALAMILIVKEAGSGFAFPARSVFLHQVDAPEIVNPEIVNPESEGGK